MTGVQTCALPIYVFSVLKRKLEIQNLQYQIQPHFLFNTLNTFKYIAIINGVESLGNGISALCSLLKDTVYGKEEMIPLSDEIRNVQNYICIQEFRYTGCIRMVYEVEEAAGVFKVPRLLLQPSTIKALYMAAPPFPVSL